MVVVPIAALATRKTLQANTFNRLHDGSCTKERIVDTQRALLIGAQDEARTKLLVEVTARHFHIAEFCFQIEVGNAPAFEVFLKSW